MASLHYAWNFKPSFRQIENFHVTDGQFGKPCHLIFYNTPIKKMVRSETCCNLEVFEEPNRFSINWDRFYGSDSFLFAYFQCYGRDDSNSLTYHTQLCFMYTG